MNKFKNLIENYKNKINEISKSNLNEDQKELIFKVMNLFAKEDECTEDELKFCVFISCFQISFI
ncbi:hypothetical protein [Mycoplasmopsis synoviae]|uniref:hypothetical protein n=1 Tax=Mycoplasmopsis synoviae TaxID=2109 RepID=UPI0022649849|nr:hypothetical protein [Mycoplasmopsis synoviae]UZW63938.1 hypothetical protein OIE45_00855 [Mycoplasmopsis synoviae]